MILIKSSQSKYIFLKEILSRWFATILFGPLHIGHMQYVQYFFPDTLLFAVVLQVH